MTESTPDAPSRAMAILHVEEALAICDALGFDLAACHLQLGLDTIIGWTPAMSQMPGGGETH